MELSPSQEAVVLNCMPSELRACTMMLSMGTLYCEGLERVTLPRISGASRNQEGWDSSATTLTVRGQPEGT